MKKIRDGKNLLHHEELDIIDESILKIASDISRKKRTIEIEELYRVSINRLSFSKKNILCSIKKLYQSAYLIEGFRLTKDNLLNNKWRKQIYNYIKKNPGTHNREIRQVFNIGSYTTFRHLKYLEIFGYIRSKKFMNKKAYFSSNTDENKDEMILVLKNERRKTIFDLISNFKKIQLNEMEKALNLNHGNIQPHLKILLKYNLIDSIKEDNIIYYIPKIDVSTEYF